MCEGVVWGVGFGLRGEGAEVRGGETGGRETVVTGKRECAIIGRLGGQAEGCLFLAEPRYDNSRCLKW